MACSKQFSIVVEENTFVWGDPIYTGNNGANSVSGEFNGYDWTTLLNFDNLVDSSEVRIQNSGAGPYDLPSTNYRLRVIVSKAEGPSTDLNFLAVFSTVNLGLVFFADAGFISNPPITVSGTYDYFFTIPATAGDTLQMSWEAVYSFFFGASPPPPVTANISINLSIVP